MHAPVSVASWVTWRLSALAAPPQRHNPGGDILLQSPGARNCYIPPVCKLAALSFCWVATSSFTVWRLPWFAVAMWRRPCLLCGGIPVLLCGGLLVFFGGFPLACWVAAALSSWWVGWGWWCHPCQHAVRCRLRDRPCRLLGASRHQGATIGRFLFWVRHVTRAQQPEGC